MNLPKPPKDESTNDDGPVEGGRLESSSEPDSGCVYTGNEPFLAIFTQAQVVVNGTRLTHKGQITHHVGDVAAQIETARRKFMHTGDVVAALQAMRRIINSFNQRVQGWESEASRRERNKANMSGGDLAKMKAEFSQVRTKSRLASRSLTKVDIELHKLSHEALLEQNGTAKPESALASDSQAQSNDSAALDQNVVADSDKPSAEELARARKWLAEVEKFLRLAIGDSLDISFEEANLKSELLPSIAEQVWDNLNTPDLSALLIAGWNVKEPSPHAVESRRKTLDINFWIVPKSLRASKSLGHLTEMPTIQISSRNLDPSDIKFEVATHGHFPQSDLAASFTKKFKNKFEIEPTILVARFKNLEWTQRSVKLSCCE